MSTRSRLKGKPGTYLVLFDLPEPLQISIGKLGLRDFNSGLYVYVGSAHGPGGLASRLGRHARTSGRKHWHIDYLKPYGQCLGALIRFGSERLECDWSKWMTQMGNRSVRGFGSSDCRCEGHVFDIEGGPSEFINQAKECLEVAWVPVAELLNPP